MLFDIMTDAQRKAFEETHDVDFSFEMEDVARFRVNVFMQRKGEAVVFRTIPTKILSLDQLGMPQVMKDLCQKEKGLILVTGPTGSGKSTTLAAMIDCINDDFEGHILTIEDPVEFVHLSKKCLVNQRELGPHTHSFANALRAAHERILMLYWLGRCETWKLFSWRSPRPRPGIWSSGPSIPPVCPTR